MKPLSWTRISVLCLFACFALAAGGVAQAQDATGIDELLGEVVRLYEEGQYTEGLEAALRTVEIAPELAPDDPRRARALFWAGRLQVVLGDYAAASPRYQRALELQEQTLGARHADVATTLNAQGELRFAAGEYDAAEPLYQQALEIREDALGSDHPDVAETLNNLAALFATQGDAERAAELCERALQIREEALGPEHPDVAQSLDLRAQIHFLVGNLDFLLGGACRGANSVFCEAT